MQNKASPSSSKRTTRSQSEKPTPPSNPESSSTSSNKRPSNDPFTAPIDQDPPLHHHLTCLKCHESYPWPSFLNVNQLRINGKCSTCNGDKSSDFRANSNCVFITALDVMDSFLQLALLEDRKREEIRQTTQEKSLTEAKAQAVDGIVAFVVPETQPIQSVDWRTQLYDNFKAYMIDFLGYGVISKGFEKRVERGTTNDKKTCPIVGYTRRFECSSRLDKASSLTSASRRPADAPPIKRRKSYPRERYACLGLLSCMVYPSYRLVLLRWKHEFVHPGPGLKKLLRPTKMEKNAKAVEWAEMQQLVRDTTTHMYQHLEDLRVADNVLQREVMLKKMMPYLKYMRKIKSLNTRSLLRQHRELNGETQEDPEQSLGDEGMARDPKVDEDVVNYVPVVDRPPASEPGLGIVRDI